MRADLKPPVKLHVGTDRAVLLAFVAEAHAHGYDFVLVAQDVADAFGAPTSTPIPMLAQRFMPDGLAVAMPPMSTTFGGPHAR